MAPNNVTGSFRGIEVSFSYNGPHIVMSVLNKMEEGRRLRVMFQQQPLSGRVNWTAFQLTGQTQDVVVPAEVIQSHKLAFYVDNHEPIATYTEKILEELKLIQDQQLLENQSTSPASESELDIPPHSETEQAGTTAENAGVEIDEVSNHRHEQENGSFDPAPELQELPPLEPENTNVNPNGDRIHTAQQENTLSETTPKENSQVATVPPKSDSVEESSSTSQRKTQYNIGQYIPSFNTELQFKIKVPSLPKSASKAQASFIPPRSASTSKSNGKKHGLFGQLAGTIGLTVPKKKEYYAQQNRHLYDKFHANLEKLERDYNNGCGIPLDNWDLESLSERQIAVLLLNLMVNEISEWKKVAKQSETTKNTLAKSLESIETELKQTLKQTRGIEAPAPTLFPDRTASTDNDLMTIQKDCDIYLQRFSEKLAELEQKHADKVKIPAFKKYLVEFVRDKLFADVAEFSSLNSVQSRLNWFLELVDFELMPIEPGKTKFSPEFHELREKRSSDFESDTIVEVVSPGLQSKDGKRVIQNAVVIQAE
jgi:molecular chaperone GrpE (heat shock protein)